MEIRLGVAGLFAVLFVASYESRHLRRVARKEEGFDAEEVEFCRQDGSTFPGLLSGTVVRNEDGEVEYYDGVSPISPSRRSGKKRFGCCRKRSRRQMIRYTS